MWTRSASYSERASTTWVFVSVTGDILRPPRQHLALAPPRRLAHLPVLQPAAGFAQLPAQLAVLQQQLRVLASGDLQQPFQALDLGEQGVVPRLRSVGAGDLVEALHHGLTTTSRKVSSGIAIRQGSRDLRQTTTGTA